LTEEALVDFSRATPALFGRCKLKEGVGACHGPVEFLRTALRIIVLVALLGWGITAGCQMPINRPRTNHPRLLATVREVAVYSLGEVSRGVAWPRTVSHDYHETRGVSSD
jgi:hypothetical protein